MYRLARFSLANRLLVALLTLFIAVFGLFTMTQLKQELIPAIELPQTTVVTAVPGASPEVLDEQVSEPISRAVGDLDGVEQVVATSSANMSMVSIAYEYGTDSDEFNASVESAIGALTTLPNDAEPNVMSGGTDQMPVIFMTASSSELDETELSAALQDTVKPRVESIEGVRSAAVSGGAVQRVEITPDQAAMAQHGLTQQAITQALQDNGTTLPLGSVGKDGTSSPVDGGTPLGSLEDLGALPLASQTQPDTVVHLDDVADLEIVTQEPTSITRMNGNRALSVSITATQGADVVGVSHAVEDAIAELTGDVPGLDLTVVFDQAPFIEHSIEGLATEGLLGLLFAVVVILVFLVSVRSTLVTALSIPISVLVTFIGLNLGGHSLNMLTLGALTIAIGRVVDDSIVVIENIKRHLAYGEPKVHAILTAVREVAGAITASTLTTVAVFLPIALVGGMVGELFAPFALTVAIAMLSSLLVALTIVPVLSYWFLKAPTDVQDSEAVRAGAEEKEHRSWLQRGYKPVLRGTQKHPVITVVASALLLVLTVSLIPLLKVDFLGNTGQNMVMVTQTFDSGTDLESVSEGAEEVEDALAGVEGVEDIMLMAGSSGGGEGDFSALLGGGGGSATFIVNTDPDADQSALQEEVRTRLATLDGPGEVSLMDPASMGGFGGSVDVAVSSQNEEDLAEAAQAVQAALEGTPHTAELTSDLAADQPTVHVAVDRAAALEEGLTEMQLLGMVAGTLSPQSVGSVTMDGDAYDIYIEGTDAPETIAELQDMPVPTAAGMVPLTDLATVEEVTVPESVTRMDGDLAATISLTPSEGELGAVTTEVQERVDALELPAGTEATMGGLAQTQQESFEQLGLAMVVAVVIVFMLLVVTFRSMMQPLILLVSIPFAATGAIGLLLISGKPLGISALIGMLMLIGIVVTNAIVLIDLINQYRVQGQSLQDAIFNGARQRLRPILMTALATIFALIPMAIGVTGSSGFISQDLAIVVIGGLISSTLLTLILVPVLYQLFEQGRERRRAARGEAVVGDVLEQELAAAPDREPAGRHRGPDTP
ncbi:hydrogenase expression protein [Kocuria sp. WN036]|uniref:efflux RND transporter permease subunit n=1 Tax=Kocuria sp. WN036 TaxID=2032628 RepID=UPI000BAB6812|nr:MULTISPECIES: efflux RND transporter permease subunit [Kocuria]NVC25454.1 efflux RND transporter permease subunit [Kocuria salina]PAU90971.1 hydrogenase expression protein [Kocuria sp. WN036]THE18991.1 efflux RND transporter permease subunit [Kocuria rosea]